MRERPILFSSSMVLALLAGTKTQTRRVVKHDHIGEMASGWMGTRADGTRYARFAVAEGGSGVVVPAPFTEGMRLWVRETWRTAKSFDKDSPTKIAAQCLKANYPEPWAPIEYVADSKRDNWEHHFGESGKTRVSIHLPRWASRITLEVTGVRVERLNDISEEDAKAEGCIDHDPEPKSEGGTIWHWPGRSSKPSFRAHFHHIWESINGEGSWKANPWVWVVKFKRVTP